MENLLPNICRKEPIEGSFLLFKTKLPLAFIFLEGSVLVYTGFALLNQIIGMFVGNIWECVL